MDQEAITSTPNKKRLVAQLKRGRDCTQKLQNMLRRRIVDGGSVSAEDLVMKIMGSFSDSLLLLSSWGSGESCPTPASTYVGSACSDGRTWDSGESEKKPAPVVKDRRGCYKRRKTEDSRVEIANTIEDGFAWRKYGQKEILDTKFPRCYYRCTHKSEGCKALKQVQKLDDGSEMFHITYFGFHTCQNLNKNSTQMFSDSETLSFFLLNYEDSKINNSPSSVSTITNGHFTPSFKQEDHSIAQSDDDYLAYDEIFMDGGCMDEFKFH